MVILMQTLGLADCLVPDACKMTCLFVSQGLGLVTGRPKLDWGVACHSANPFGAYMFYKSQACRTTRE